MFLLLLQVTGAGLPGVRTASIYSRFFRKKEEQEPPVSPASEERRKYMPGEDGMLIKDQMHKLSAKTLVFPALFRIANTNTQCDWKLKIK